MKARGQGGFTLIEVVVVAAIIAILAGILVPIIFKEIDEARITRAAADVRSISTAMFIFRKDAAQWPYLSDDCSTVTTLIAGDGNPPSGDIAALGYDTSVTKSFNYYLQGNNGCYPNWRGPYMAGVTPDPWGRKYYVNSKQFPSAADPVWIISAGPNGALETPAASQTLVGDDIGLMIKVGIPPTT